MVGITNQNCVDLPACILEYLNLVNVEIINYSERECCQSFILSLSQSSLGYNQTKTRHFAKVLSLLPWDPVGKVRYTEVH